MPKNNYYYPLRKGYNDATGTYERQAELKSTTAKRYDEKGHLPARGSTIRAEAMTPAYLRDQLSFDMF